MSVVVVSDCGAHCVSLLSLIDSYSFSHTEKRIKASYYIARVDPCMHLVLLLEGKRRPNEKTTQVRACVGRMLIWSTDNGGGCKKLTSFVCGMLLGFHANADTEFTTRQRVRLPAQREYGAHDRSVKWTASWVHATSFASGECAKEARSPNDRSPSLAFLLFESVHLHHNEKKSTPTIHYFYFYGLGYRTTLYCFILRSYSTSFFF